MGDAESGALPAAEAPEFALGPGLLLLARPVIIIT
jgi:hypothetical protein